MDYSEKDKFLEGEKDLKIISSYLEDYFYNSIKDILKKLDFLSSKVAEVHGPIHKELISVDNILKEFSLMIENYLSKEKQYFLPIILDESFQKKTKKILDFINKSKEIQKDYLLNLKEIRNLTNNYIIPKDACKTYTGLLTNLLKLDEFLIKYMNIENNIFFPLILAKLK